MDNGVLSLTQRSSAPSAPSNGLTNVYTDTSGSLIVQNPSGESTNINSSINSLITQQDGWVPANQTWTYASATTFTIVGDYSAILTKGMKFKLTANSVVLQGYILSATYSSPNTTVTVCGNALTSHTFTNNFYSVSESPASFPTVFTYTPTITWTAGAAPSGSPTKKELFWITGNVCHIRIFNFGYTAGTSVTSVSIPLPVTHTNEFQAINNLSIGVVNAVSANHEYGIIGNTTLFGNCTSVNANYVSASADYYF